MFFSKWDQWSYPISAGSTVNYPRIRGREPLHSAWAHDLSFFWDPIRWLVECLRGVIAMRLIAGTFTKCYGGHRCRNCKINDLCAVVTDCSGTSSLSRTALQVHAPRGLHVIIPSTRQHTSDLPLLLLFPPAADTVLRLIRKSELGWRIENPLDRVRSR